MFSILNIYFFFFKQNIVAQIHPYALEQKSILVWYFIHRDHGQIEVLCLEIYFYSKMKMLHIGRIPDLLKSKIFV